MISRFVFQMLMCSMVATVVQAGQKCKDSAGNSPCTGTNSPCVCVEFAAGDPQEDVDFRLDFAEQYYPDVTFLTGSLTWKVWSQVNATKTAPMNLGDLRIDASVSTDNFAIQLRNPNFGFFGAANLKSAVLKDTTSWSGYSSIASDSWITGDLMGNLEVVATGGTGGEVEEFYIGGDAPSDISIHRAGMFQILGVASGNITIHEIAYISIGDLTGSLNIAEAYATTFTVYIIDGIGPTGVVSFGDSLIAPTTSHFVVGDVEGTIQFADGTPDNLLMRVDRGNVSGSILTDADNDGVGDLKGTFSIDVGQLNGLVSGVNLLGDIIIGGCGPSTGSIEMTGNFGVGSSLTIHGDFAGEIIADADGLGGGGIYGDITVEDEFTGNICGSNVSLGNIPSNISMDCWCPDGRVCDEFYGYFICLGPFYLIAAGPRYLEVGNCFIPTPPYAIKVTGACTDGDVNCVSKYAQADGSLGTVPYYQESIDWGILFLTGEEIVPSKTYLVQGEPQSTPSNLTYKLRATTWMWGDVYRDDEVNLDDLICLLSAFNETYYEGCTLQCTDLATCQPNGAAIWTILLPCSWPLIVSRSSVPIPVARAS